MHGELTGAGGAGGGGISLREAIGWLNSSENVGVGWG